MENPFFVFWWMNHFYEVALSSMPMYFFSMFCYSTQVASRMKGIHINFLWTNNDIKCKYYLVGWNSV